MSSQPNLNVLNLSTQSLLIVIIFIILLQIYGIIKCSEGLQDLKPWDTFDARFQQSRDDYGIGATSAGDSMRQKSLNYISETEGLVGTQYPIKDIESIYPEDELPKLEKSELERTEKSLEHILRGY